MSLTISPDIQSAWSALRGASLSQISGGLINMTYLVEAQNGRFILQRLNPIFDAIVHHDIDAITKRLEQQSLPTPRLIPTDAGSLFVETPDGVFRLQTAIEGITHHRLTSPALAFEAGQHVALFHRALAGFDYDYRFTRPFVHDTSKHLETLTTALHDHQAHSLSAQVMPVAERVLQTAQESPSFEHLPNRHAHGDLKISNFIFSPEGQVQALIDLDTVSTMKWPLEMGDALRSWCNPHAEDHPTPFLDLTLLENAVKGYGSVDKHGCTQEEIDLLFAGLETICLELSARFLADALQERYFGWDNTNYPSRGAHNLARGKAMHALWQDCASKRQEATAMISRHLKPCSG